MAKNLVAMSPHKLPPQAYRAVRMLAADKRPSEVANQCQCSTETLRRWRQRPDFEHLLAVARAERRTQRQDENVRASVRAMQRVEELAMKAVDTVEALLEDPDSKVRMMAARALYEWGQPSGNGNTGSGPVIMISAANVQMVEKAALMADLVKQKYGAGEPVTKVLGFGDLSAKIPVDGGEGKGGSDA